ncbi:DUF1742-domain-containing protein [Xylariomycetidae sp. FL0641]|nr:DUF1742-domain-containing protein [Xylariomycetidae sp. FL0641]
MSFPNVWYHRKVAETAAKGCEVCFKPSSSVLTTPENKDFFYVCPAHLKDRGFCSPIIDHAAVAARKKKEEDEEIERVKKEYEEKQRKKKEKKNEDEKSEKDKEKKEGDAKEDEKDNSKTTKDDAKSEDKEKVATDTASKKEEEPRVFALQKTFYQQRLDRKRQAEMAKRNRERLSNPNFFPSVPKD